MQCSQNGLEKLFRGSLADAFVEFMESLWERGRSEAEAVKAMLERFGVGPGGRLLELGAGIGRVAAYLAEMGYIVDGVEYSEVFVEKGRKLLRERGLGDRVRLLHGDAYNLDEVVGSETYDAVYMVWSTLLGYGPSRDCDRLLLEVARRHVEPHGLFVVANTVSYDREAFINICGCRGPFMKLMERHAVVEDPRFDALEQVLVSRWTFYRRRGPDLEYMDEAVFRLRIYTLSELARLAEEAGWRLLAAYHDPVRGTPYRPGASGFNLVFEAA